MIVALGLLPGCASLMPRVAEPIGPRQVAVVEGFLEVRARGDLLTPQVSQVLDKQFRQILASGSASRRDIVNYLAVSGGGSDGAFASGFLNGWTAAGTRPEFEAVTGVSTGALVAPFAFLGPAYDRSLKRIYTQITDKDVYTSNGIFGVVGESLLDPTPLRRMIEGELTDEFMDKLAAEHERGRRLLIQTTDIERQIPYIWNITKIATHRNVDRRKLITDILMASAAVPGVFPPVRFEVTVDGVQIEELHVDGGLAAQVFFAPPGLNLSDYERRYFGKSRQKHMVLIRNGKLDPETNATDPQTLPLAARAISTLIKYQSKADIDRVRRLFAEPGSSFRAVGIPDGFNVQASGLFDRDYMKALYKVGFDQGYSYGRQLRR